jgi:hypothetical protein
MEEPARDEKRTHGCALLAAALCIRAEGLLMRIAQEQELEVVHDEAEAQGLAPPHVRKGTQNLSICTFSESSDMCGLGERKDHVPARLLVAQRRALHSSFGTFSPHSTLVASRSGPR